MRTSRLLLILGIACFGAISSAQITVTDPADDAAAQIQEAFESFATVRTAKFRIAVTDSKDLLNKHFSTVEASYSFFDKDFPKFELCSYSSDLQQPRVLLRRVVADGRTFWDYDATTNTFSSTDYGGAGAKSAMINLVDRAFPGGPPSLISKLLTQVFGGPRPRFRNWIRGSEAHPAGQFERFVTMQFGNSAVGERSIAMAIGPLARIIYAEHQPGPALNVPSSTWDMSIIANGGGVANYAFAQPQGAKRVAFGG